ncbi:MAG TPA: flagellar motor switch protein FliN [Solirubrobacteraceae bacterium]|nr:flagellar motor switch protein FliN [Solirubrobacteraceae bacterium]
MPDTIEYEQFEQGATPGGDGALDVDLSRLSDIPMELSVEIGRTHMTVGETLDLRVGSVVTLERLAGEAADLLVNGSAIARGEVVVIDEQYGLRITEILDGQSDSQSADALTADGGQGTDGAAAGGAGAAVGAGGAADAPAPGAAGPALGDDGPSGDSGDGAAGAAADAGPDQEG